MDVIKTFSPNVKHEQMRKCLLDVYLYLIFRCTSLVQFWEQQTEAYSVQGSGVIEEQNRKQQQQQQPHHNCETISKLTAEFLFFR